MRDQSGPQTDVRLIGVRKSFASPAGVRIIALDGVDLEVSAGEIVAVMGPSGSGKSTLLHIIGGMDTADAGHIQVGRHILTGHSVRQMVDYRRSVGFVFQRFHLLPALSARDNVLAPVLPYHLGRTERRRAADLLDRVGLAERTRSLPAQLSGGEQQRVALARALVNQPAILLADEPTGNLDSETGAQIMRLVKDVHHDVGMTAIIATHNDLVARECDRVVHLRDGRVSQAEPTR